MPWAAAAAVAGAYLSSEASKKGAKGAQSSADAATAEQARQFDINQENQRPFLEAGHEALAAQRKLLQGDYSGFDQSPDYQWALQQGTRQLDAGAASRGNLWGGGADADRINYGQGQATQFMNNYWNKLAGQAGQGQLTANNLGAAGQQYATNVGNIAMGNASRQSSFGQQSADAWGNTIGQLTNLFGQYQGSKKGTG